MSNTLGLSVSEFSTDATTKEAVSMSDNQMWFQISVTLFVVVAIFIVLLIACFIRQRRTLRETFTHTLNRKVKERFLPFHENEYNNPGFDEGIRDNTCSKTQTEDVGIQVQDLSISRRKDPHCESGFESFPGSILDRRRNDNVYESGLGSMEGSIRDKFKLDLQDQYSTVQEKQIVFRSHHSRISEERVNKEEIELQRRETCAISKIPDFKDVMTEIIEYNKELETSTNEDEISMESDYENVDLISSVKKKDISEDQGSINLENPTYGFVDYDRKSAVDLLCSESENESEQLEEEQHDYLNTGRLRDEYMNNLKSQSKPTTLNFLNLNWDYRCDVDKNGGLLKAQNSDISLCLPQNFITTQPATSIFWSIFAQDCEVKAKTGFDSCIVSPVVEYYTPFKEKFNEYVIIDLPHCISQHYNNRIQTFWFDPAASPSDGQVQVHEVPEVKEVDLHLQNVFPDTFFVHIHPGFVTIYTTHFSVYFCACAQNFPLELYAVTFGKYVPIDHSQVNVKLKVHIADAKITLRDCFQKLKDDEQSLGFTFKGKTEIDLDETVTGNDSIEIKVDFEDVPRNMNPVWKHSVDREGFPIHPITKKWHIGHRYKCDNHKFIQTTKEWQFKNESPPRYRTVFQCFIEILYRKVIEQSDTHVDYSDDSDENLLTTSCEYQAMGPFVVTDRKPELISQASRSTNTTDHRDNLVCLRTRMTVDIDLSDTVIENQYSDSMDQLQSFHSRRGILPSIIYELIDGLDDDKFDELCRRLGADRELSSFKQRFEDSLSRGKKYELLDNIRDAMSDGKFCKDIITVLLTMKENKLRQAISDHIQNATQTYRHSVVSIEPQSANFQRLIPLQNEDTYHQQRDYNINDETHRKEVQNEDVCGNR